ncbi:MAG: response regulator transcription factor [Lachnospiraceae bacterium]|nr:response regulator transcription factor [Lachnospiraceae bacterium]
MSAALILVVDDDPEIARLVQLSLEEEDYQVLVANDGETALELFEANEVDLAILDIMMPGMDGNEVCRRIREISHIPIIMLSARGTQFDKVSGLDNGADDYVTKPFDSMELIARVKSQLRRYNELGGSEVLNSGEIKMENLWLDRDGRQVKAYGKSVELTPIEFDILYFLASHPNTTFSTDEIFENVWKEEIYQMSNTVMVHIRRLRQKIELDPKNSEIIKTVWGVGYRIEK